MASEQSHSMSSKNRSISPVVAAVVFLLAIGMMFFVYNRSSAPVATSEQFSPQAMTGKFLRQKAMESGGDFNKLSPQDQQQVQQITNGKGAAELQRLYQQK